MQVAVIGAGAMGSALTIPLVDNSVKVNLWGTEYDIDMLERIKRCEEHPRIKAKLPKLDVFYPKELEEALKGVDVILLAVSTAGVLPVFERIKDFLGNAILVTVAKGLLEVDGKVLTVPQALWRLFPELEYRIVAITGPSIAREVANKVLTRVMFSCKDLDTAKKAASAFQTSYYVVEESDDIVGAEITSALKNVYSISISWIKGYTSRAHFSEMNNTKGVLAVQALKEIASVVKALGGKVETVYGLSGLGDLIATFEGGRNGMLGELLGKGLSTEEALNELHRMGVGVIEGYETAKKAYKLVKDLKKEEMLKEEFPLLKATYNVLYENKKVEDVLQSVIG
jgi:glycerol-3-phosphate dehydrogenase (NAD(P)+)